MACRLFAAKPLSESMPTYCQLDPWEQISVKFVSKSNNINCRNFSWKCHLESGGHFVSASMCYLQNILKNQLGRKLKRAFFNTSWCYIPATIASSRAESYALDKMERTHIDVFGHISWGEKVFCNHLDLDVYLLFFTMLPIDMRSMTIVNRKITTA